MYYAHKTEERRNAEGKRIGWQCVTCSQWWVSTRNPTSTCPGVRAYYTWERAAQAGMLTATQWRAKRRKVLPDAKPTGAKMFGASKPSDWYDLYSEDQTTPMREYNRKA